MQNEQQRASETGMESEQKRFQTEAIGNMSTEYYVLLTEPRKVYACNLTLLLAALMAMSHHRKFAWCY